jgi:hypothetical protein
MTFNNGSSSFPSATILIGMENLSSKQLLGECIDLATRLLKELVIHYLQSNNMKDPFDKVLTMGE